MTELRALWEEAAALDAAATARRLEAIEGALRLSAGLESRAAALLGVPRQTLQWWVREYADLRALCAQLRDEKGYSFGRPRHNAVTEVAQSDRK